MSSLKSSSSFATDPGSEKGNDAWPTIGEALNRSRGSSPLLKTGKDIEKDLGIDQCKISSEKSQKGDSKLDEFPGNNKQTTQSTYSAAVGVEKVDIQIKITEEDGERIGLILEGFMTETKPLWTDLLVGKFPSKIPNLKDIFFTVNKIWTLGNMNIRIEVFKVSDTLVKFRIPDKNTRERILRRGMWSIMGLPMNLSKWAPIEELEEIEIRVVPIWITIKKVPKSLFHWKGLSYISKVVGKPIKLHPETVQCVKFDEAKILVEADINVPMPKNHKFRSESSGIFSVDFLYPWVPRRCTKCFQWGHSEDSCKDDVKNQQMVHKDNVEKARDENKSESMEKVEVEVRSESPSRIISKNLGETSQEFIKEDLTRSDVAGNQKHGKVEEIRNLNSNQSNDSYIKATWRKIFTAEDALEELRMVKEGLRQVSPYSSGSKMNTNVENQIEVQNGNNMQGNKINSPVTQVKEHQELKAVGDSLQDKPWSTVSNGKGSRKKEDTEAGKEFQIPLSSSRYEILAESLEEMEMMISNDDCNHEEVEDESKELDYDSQVEKMLNEKMKTKTKEKEGKPIPIGTRGRGRGRKPKKQ